VQDLRPRQARAKKKSINVVSLYVNNVDLISLRQRYKYAYMEHEEKAIKTDGRKLLLDALNPIGISGRERVPNYRGIFKLGTD
jgi:hypothetical protein